MIREKEMDLYFGDNQGFNMFVQVFNPIKCQCRVYSTCRWCHF